MSQLSIIIIIIIIINIIILITATPIIVGATAATVTSIAHLDTATEAALISEQRGRFKTMLDAPTNIPFFRGANATSGFGVHAARLHKAPATGQIGVGCDLPAVFAHPTAQELGVSSGASPLHAEAYASEHNTTTFGTGRGSFLTMLLTIAAVLYRDAETFITSTVPTEGIGA